MSEFSKVSRTLFHKSRKFKAQADDGRLLYLYLLVNQHVTSCGCYQLDEGYAKTDLRWPEERFVKGMEALSEGLLIRWDRPLGTVLIENWVEFNEPSNAKHAMGILRTLNEADSEVLMALRFAELKQCIHEKKLHNERLIGNDLLTIIKWFDDRIETLSPSKNKNKTEIKSENNTEKKNETEKETQTAGAALRPPASEGGLAPLEANELPPLSGLRSESPLLKTNFIKGDK